MLGAWDVEGDHRLFPQRLGLTRGANIAFYPVTSIGPILFMGLPIG
jgi:hypothetical protein